MVVIRKVYDTFCRIEEIIAGSFIVIVTSLVFLSAVARTIKHPINWAQDVSLLLFAWTVFLGADVALRDSSFVNVDMFITRLPQKIQTVLFYLWNTFIMGFLILLVRFGIPLSLENSKRLFQTLGISYSWASISVPIGSLFMVLTIFLKMLAHRKKLEARS